MDMLEVKREWPFACNGGKPVKSEDDGQCMNEYVYVPELQLNVWRATGKPVVESAGTSIGAATTYKTAVVKEQDRPDAEGYASIYTSSVTKAQGENDRPDPESLARHLPQGHLLAATSRLTEVGKEHDQPD